MNILGELDALLFMADGALKAIGPRDECLAELQKNQQAQQAEEAQRAQQAQPAQQAASTTQDAPGNRSESRDTETAAVLPSLPEELTAEKAEAPVDQKEDSKPKKNKGAADKGTKS
jgi:hypothetical protein